MTPEDAYGPCLLPKTLPGSIRGVLHLAAGPAPPTQFNLTTRKRATTARDLFGLRAANTHHYGPNADLPVHRIGSGPRCGRAASLVAAGPFVDTLGCDLSPLW